MEGSGVKIKAECSQCGHAGEIGFTDVFSDEGLRQIAAWYRVYAAQERAVGRTPSVQDTMLAVEVIGEIEERERTGQPASERRIG